MQLERPTLASHQRDLDALLTQVTELRRLQQEALAVLEQARLDLLRLIDKDARP